MKVKKLFRALAAAQGKLSAIQKNLEGPRGDYVSIDAAVSHSRAALASEGILLFQTAFEIVPMGKRPERNTDMRTGEVSDCERTQFFIKRAMTLVHMESGENVELTQTWPVNDYGSKAKSLDHSVAAADSFGLTYLLRDLLLFCRGEEYDTSDMPRTEAEYNKGPELQPEDYGQQYDAGSMAETQEESGQPGVVQYARILLSGKLSREQCDAVKDGAAIINAAQLREVVGWDLAPSAEDLEAVGPGLMPGPMKADLWKATAGMTEKYQAIWGALAGPDGVTGDQGLVIAALCFANRG